MARAAASPRSSGAGTRYSPACTASSARCELMGEVPVVCAVLGTAAGGPAGRAILSHWSVMVKGTSQVFAAGPPVVERSLGQKINKEELGGAEDRRRSSPAPSTSRRRDETRVLRDDPPLPVATCRRTSGSCRRSSRIGDPADRCEDALASSCRATAAGPTTCARSCAGRRPRLASSRSSPPSARRSSPASRA